MLKLYILRHANSGWAMPGQKDVERSLSSQGIEQLNIIGETISSMNYAPDKIICSYADRTKQTYSGIKDRFSEHTQIEFNRDIYSCEIDQYFDLIKSQNHIKGLMIIGHNPMCAGITAQLTASGADYALKELAMGYPAGSLAALEFDCENWSDISYQSGFLREFHIPR